MKLRRRDFKPQVGTEIILLPDILCQKLENTRVTPKDRLTETLEKGCGGQVRLKTRKGLASNDLPQAPLHSLQNVGSIALVLSELRIQNG